MHAGSSDIEKQRALRARRQPKQITTSKTVLTTECLDAVVFKVVGSNGVTAGTWAIAIPELLLNMANLLGTAGYGHGTL